VRIDVMPDGAEQLRSALQRCVVHVPGATDIPGGSGFFVAPGYVLTCAHVVGGRDGAELTLRWEDVELPGRVEHAEPASRGAGRLWAAPDLAIIRLLRPPRHPCVWLGETPTSDGTPLYAFGFGSVYADAAPTTARVWSAGPQGVDGGTGLRVRDDELPAGMSGSPVLNLMTGEVCAVVKTARIANQPQGGLAIPLVDMRRLPLHPLLRDIWRGHDQYHAADGTWPGMLDRLRERRRYGDGPLMDPADLLNPEIVWPVLRAAEEARLRGILARLPAADDARELYDQATWPHHPDPGRALLDRRDVIRALDDCRGPWPGELHSMFVFALAVADRSTADLAAELCSWVAEVAGRLGQRALLDQWRTGAAGLPRQRRRGDGPASVLVWVSPSGHDSDLYRVSMSIYRSAGDVTTFFERDDPTSLSEIWAELAQLVPRAWRVAGAASSTMIELIVPEDLLDAAVEDWPVSDGRPYARLGLVLPVVVRVQERDGEPERRVAAEQRWNQLSAAGSQLVIKRFPCGNGTDPQRVYSDMISQRPAVLGLPGPATEPAHRMVIEVGAYVGMPAALWRRAPCPRHHSGASGATCGGEPFLARLVASLSGATLDELPQRVRDMRIAADRQPHDEHCGRGLVLLWDNPFRRPHPHPPSLVLEETW